MVTARPHMGVFALKCRSTHRFLIFTSLNARTYWLGGETTEGESYDGLYTRLQENRCKWQDLQRDWNRYGESNFEIITLDRYTDRKTFLKVRNAKKNEWLARMTTSRPFYNPQVDFRDDVRDDLWLDVPQDDLEAYEEEID